MATCPKCGKPMRIDGTRMICPNESCPYGGYEVPVKTLSLPEALKRIAELEKHIRYLEGREE